jgi:hypothetical protein
VIEEVAQRSLERSPLPLIARMTKHADARVALNLLENPIAAGSAAVINDDDRWK